MECFTVLETSQLQHKHLIKRWLLFKTHTHFISWRHDMQTLSILLCMISRSQRWFPWQNFSQVGLWHFCQCSCWTNSRVTGDLRHHDAQVKWLQWIFGWRGRNMMFVLWVCIQIWSCRCSVICRIAVYWPCHNETRLELVTYVSAYMI